MCLKRKHGLRGFTLVELLVVIAIIAVLAALSVAGYRAITASAYKTQSIAKIRALADANIAYAIDNNGKFVPVYGMDGDGALSTRWNYNPEFLRHIKGADQTYLSNGEVDVSFPVDSLDPIVAKKQADYWTEIGGSYGYTDANKTTWGTKGGNNRFTQTNVPDPARTAQFITATDWIAKYNGRFLWEENSKEGYVNGRIAYRHGGKAIAVFYDGHAETIDIAGMKEIDRNGGVDNIFWGGQTY